MEKERREAPPQKRDPIFRSSSIDTSTPRLQPDHRRLQSFSSPAYSPAVSPSYSDHSTSRGFYSPRGGEDEEKVDGSDDDVDEELHDVDERGYLYRPRSPVEMPVISTVSRSVRVEPEVETRVDEREFVERRVVEEDVGGGGLAFGGGGRGLGRRKWEGRNTVVFESRSKEKELSKVQVPRIDEEESSLEFREFRGRKVSAFGAKEKEIVVPEKRVVEEESVKLGDRRGQKSNAFESDSGEKDDVIRGMRVVEDESVEFRDGRGRRLNAFVSDSDMNGENLRGQRVVEEESVEFRDGRGRRLNAFVSDSDMNGENLRGQRVVEEESVELGDRSGRKSNPLVFDSNMKEKEFVRGRKILEGNVELRDGRGIGVRFDAMNAMVVDSSPKLEFGSRAKDEVASTKTLVYESRREEFDGARVVEEGIDGGGEGVEGARPSMMRRREGRRNELLVMMKAALLFRVLGLVMCVISFSIMATNKNKGWALDSFDRYKEFRYCMAVSILGFVYSAAQACIVAYHMSTDKYSNQHSQLRYYLDFFLDQAISYLLISASSSAATRVEDWVSNWGKDKFPQMANASVIVSFFAFGAFAFSSLVSGYTLCSANVS